MEIEVMNYPVFSQWKREPMPALKLAGLSLNPDPHQVIRVAGFLNFGLNHEANNT